MLIWRKWFISTKLFLLLPWHHHRVHQLSPALTSCRIIKLRLNHSRDEDLKQHSLWFTLQTDIFYEQALAFKETLILFASAFMQTGRTNDSDSSIFCSVACINGHHYLSTRFMLLWWMIDKYQLISDHDHTCYMCSGLFTTVSLLGMWYSAITVASLTDWTYRISPSFLRPNCNFRNCFPSKHLKCPTDHGMIRTTIISLPSSS